MSTSAASHPRAAVRVAARILWGVLGVPVAAFLLVLLTTVLFPVGGGILHVMFAHTPGGSLGGARAVFAGFLLATAVVTSALRALRYPLPWYVTALLVGGLAVWMWLRPVLSSAAGDAFRLQGLLLAPLLPATALVMGYWSERRRRRIVPPAA